MNMSHIVKVTELKLIAKFHDDWSKQSVSNVTSPNFANYEVTHALTYLSSINPDLYNPYSDWNKEVCSHYPGVKREWLWFTNVCMTIDALKPVGLGKLLLESDVYKIIEQDIMRT